nr:hypothetical protein [Mucilaginibacter rubeus]
MHAFEGTQPYFSYPRVLAMSLRANWLKQGAHKIFQKETLLHLSPVNDLLFQMIRPIYSDF